MYIILFGYYRFSLEKNKQEDMYVACLPCITQKEVLKSYELEFMGGQKLTEIIQYMVY